MLAVTSPHRTLLVAVVMVAGAASSCRSGASRSSSSTVSTTTIKPSTTTTTKPSATTVAPGSGVLQWRDGPSLPVAVSEVGVAAAGGQIHVLGGYVGGRAHS